MKLPITTYTIDHEVVDVDMFEDADSKPVYAQELVDALNTPPPSEYALFLQAFQRIDPEENRHIRGDQWKEEDPDRVLTVFDNHGTPIELHFDKDGKLE